MQIRSRFIFGERDGDNAGLNPALCRSQER